MAGAGALDGGGAGAVGRGYSAFRFCKVKHVSVFCTMLIGNRGLVWFVLFNDTWSQ